MPKIQFGIMCMIFSRFDADDKLKGNNNRSIAKINSNTLTVRYGFCDIWSRLSKSYHDMWIYAYTIFKIKMLVSIGDETILI